MDPALRGGERSFQPRGARRAAQLLPGKSSTAITDAFRPHMHHWIELARACARTRTPSPIRATPSLYNIFDARSEGLATGVEEMFMHLGLLDEKLSPGTRTSVDHAGAAGGARALSGLNLHGEVFDMEEAVEARDDLDAARMAYPRATWCAASRASTSGSRATAPATSAARSSLRSCSPSTPIQEGDDFTIKRFFDAFYGAGVIPIVLTRWEMTGGEGSDSGAGLRFCR